MWEGIIGILWYVISHVKHRDMAQLRTECLDGNDRACETLEAVCERGDDDA